MATASGSRVLRTIPVLIVVCVVGFPVHLWQQGCYAESIGVQTSTYVFDPNQSTIVQTGGIAGVHWTYSIEGQFELAVDPNAGTASFARVDANATDDRPFKRTLDPNRVFNMTRLAGTIVDHETIAFAGKAPDGSDIVITVILEDGLAHLIGHTTPPPHSADFFIFNLDAVAQRKYGGGSGTAEDPYQIATAADLIALGEEPNDYDKHFILTADIDLDPNIPGRRIFDRAVIAPDTNDVEDWFQGTPFAGVFDGNGHTVSNLTIVGASYLGLFGEIDNAAISDLGLEAVDVDGSGGFVGSLAGYAPGTISNCYGSGTVSGAGVCVGGLLGSAAGCITRCYSTAEVSGSNVAGGLVGNSRGNITESHSTGVVNGSHRVGGLVGNNRGSITESYSAGAVSGDSEIGGLVGMNDDASITESYSTGAVSGDSHIGGLVGCNGPSPITMSYSTGTVIGRGWAIGGLVGGNYGSIADSYSTGKVSGATAVGGLVGHNGNSIVMSHSTGSVDGESEVGGLVGENTYSTWWSPGGPVAYGDIVRSWSIGSANGQSRIGGLVGRNGSDVTMSYSTGSVSGVSEVGGLVGANVGGQYMSDPLVHESYSSGRVVGNTDVGGLIGWNENVVTISYWDAETSGEPNMCGYADANASGCDNSYGRTTAEMKQQSTFEGWDFVNVWGIGENQTYPYLRRYSAADINQDESVDFGDLAILADNWLASIPP
ncbi:MAG: hypothetical protein JSU70_13570 [Phycisphaerales bacterium]|nr:MAG: hypothetical protein JSU70_13570 [Phycisphaerales bacterium]